MEEHDWTWGHFTHDLTHELLHVDSKIFQSFWLLFRRPGFLTAEYWAGRRTLYLTPFRIYLLAAAVHFLAVHYGLFVPEGIQVNHQAVSTADVMSVAAEGAHLPAERVPELRHMFEIIYKFSVYLGPMMLALGSWLWFRKRKPYFIQHVIFATHVYAVWFLLTPLNGFSPSVRRILPVVSSAYLFFAARHLYGGSLLRNLGQAIYLRAMLSLAEIAAVGVAVTGAIFWGFVAKGH